MVIGEPEKVFIEVEETEDIPAMEDLSDPLVVQIVLSDDGRRLWINVDGVCRLRCSRIVNLDLKSLRNTLRVSPLPNESP